MDFPIKNGDCPKLCNVGTAIINHPPVITFITVFMGGIPTIKNGWFIIAIPTL